MCDCNSVRNMKIKSMIDIDKKVAEAVENFKNGYNCCQAVVMVYSDIANVNTEVLATIAAPFGGGMGRMREVCGSVTGMFMVSGFVFKAVDPSNTEAKNISCQAVQQLAKKFKDDNGSIICRELLGLGNKEGAEPNAEQKCKKRPCVEYVADCTRFIGEMIIEKSNL